MKLALGLDDGIDDDGIDDVGLAALGLVPPRRVIFLFLFTRFVLFDFAILMHMYINYTHIHFLEMGNNQKRTHCLGKK